MSEFEIQLSRKPIKNINLRIDMQGNVKVSAPYRCSLSSINKFLEAKREWIIHHRQKILSRGFVDLSALEVKDEHRKQLETFLIPMIQKWEPIIGVHADQWGIKKMKTRWGSCNTVKKRIWINLYLIHKPLLCLEYVVVHELVHLLEASHNKRFYQLMTRFMPDWKIYKKLLQE